MWALIKKHEKHNAKSAYLMIHPKYVHDDVIGDPKILNNFIILLTDPSLKCGRGQR